MHIIWVHRYALKGAANSHIILHSQLAAYAPFGIGIAELCARCLQTLLAPPVIAERLQRILCVLDLEGRLWGLILAWPDNLDWSLICGRSRPEVIRQL